jgi:hypothetical protein
VAVSGTQSVAVSGSQWQSVSGSQWQSVAVSGSQWQSVSGSQWQAVALTFMYTSSESMASVIVSYSAQSLTSSRLTKPSTCPSSASRVTVRLMSRMRLHWRYRQKATKKKPRSEGQSYLHSGALRRTQAHNQAQSDRLHQLDLSSGAIRSLVPIRLVRPVRAEPFPTHRLELIRNEKGDESQKAAFDEKESRETIGIERIVPVGKGGRRSEHLHAGLGRPLASSESYLWGREGAVVSTCMLV